MSGTTTADRPVLVVDNFDSFVYNLVQYLGQLGVRCIVRRNDAVAVEELPDLDVAGVLDVVAVLGVGVARRPLGQPGRQRVVHTGQDASVWPARRTAVSQSSSAATLTVAS